MTKKHLLIVLMIVANLEFSLSAAELGRRPVRMTPPRGGSQPEIVTAYGKILSEGATGLELDLAWNTVDWDVGSTSYDDNVWTPQISFYYGVSDSMDVRLSAKILSLKDEASDMDAIRVGIGIRGWLSAETDITPYIGLLVNYYSLDSDSIGDMEGTFGLSGEAGIAYLASDTLLIRAGIHGETFLDDAEGNVNGSDMDVSLTAVGVSIGITVLLY